MPKADYDDTKKKSQKMAILHRKAQEERVVLANFHIRGRSRILLGSMMYAVYHENAGLRQRLRKYRYSCTSMTCSPFTDVSTGLWRGRGGRGVRTLVFISLSCCSMLIWVYPERPNPQIA